MCVYGIKEDNRKGHYVINHKYSPLYGLHKNKNHLNQFYKHEKVKDNLSFTIEIYNKGCKGT